MVVEITRFGWTLYKRMVESTVSVGESHPNGRSQWRRKGVRRNGDQLAGQGAFSFVLTTTPPPSP